MLRLSHLIDKNRETCFKYHVDQLPFKSELDTIDSNCELKKKDSKQPHITAKNDGGNKNHNDNCDRKSEANLSTATIKTATVAATVTADDILMSNSKDSLESENKITPKVLRDEEKAFAAFITFEHNESYARCIEDAR